MMLSLHVLSSLSPSRVPDSFKIFQHFGNFTYLLSEESLMSHTPVRLTGENSWSDSIQKVKKKKMLDSSFNNQNSQRGCPCCRGLLALLPKEDWKL